MNDIEEQLIELRDDLDWLREKEKNLCDDCGGRTRMFLDNAWGWPKWFSEQACEPDGRCLKADERGDLEEQIEDTLKRIGELECAEVA
jgi:hypothetical protein